MRRILLFFIALFTITGCVDSAQTISVLNAADSLISERPDSAYRLLQTLDGCRIWQDENEARYALLLTQTKHKNYIKSESDSLINIAVDYYRNAHDSNMYARALFYQGTVNEDMGDSDAAIENYKAADATITTDTLLLAFINSNIGWLYSNEHGKEVIPVAIERLQKALKYFKIAKDYKSANYTLGRIGQIYRTYEKQDSAQFYLNLACRLSKTLKDTITLLGNYTHLVTSYFIDNKYESAKELALYVIAQYPKAITPQELYLSLSKLYAAQNKIDSAHYYLNSTPIDSTNLFSYYLARSNIEKAAGDYKSAFESNEKSQILFDSIMLENNKFHLYEVEKRYDNQLWINQNKELKYQSLVNKSIIGALIIGVLLLIAIYHIVINRKNRIMQNAIAFAGQLDSEYTQSKNRLVGVLDGHKQNELKLRNMLEKRLDVIRQLMDITYRHSNNPNMFLKQFNQVMAYNSLDKGVLNDITSIVNIKYPGLIDHIVSKYPKLSSDDLNLLSLVCFGFSPYEICVFYNIASTNALYVKRHRLITKLDIQCDLDGFIHQMMTELGLYSL